MIYVRQCLLAPVLLCLTVLSPLPAASPVFHAAFENSDSSWTTLRGAAIIDSAVTHENLKSMRVEPDAGGRDAAIQSVPMALTIGKRYELTGWIRTERVSVRDLGRTPIAIGTRTGAVSSI